MPSTCSRKPCTKCWRRLLAVADDVQAGVLLGLDPQQRGIELGLLQRGALGLPLRPQLLRLGQPGGLGQAAGDGGVEHGCLLLVVNYQASTKPRRGGSGRPAAVARPRGSQARVSAGSMTSSISRWLAMFSAWPLATASATRRSNSASRSPRRGGLQFLAEAQPHRAFDAHRPELAAGPGGSRHRRVEVAGRQRHRAQAVAATQHHAEHRHAQRGGGDEQPPGVAHHRRLLALRPDHEARRVDEGDRSAGRRHRPAA